MGEKDGGAMVESSLGGGMHAAKPHPCFPTQEEPQKVADDP